MFNQFIHIIIKILFGFSSIFYALTPFNTAFGDSGIFIGDITTAGAALSSGQQESLVVMTNICASLFPPPAGVTTPPPPPIPGVLACNIAPVGTGVLESGLAAQNLSPQAAIQADTIAVTSPHQFIRSFNKQAQKLIDCNPEDLKSKDKKNNRHRCMPRGGGSGDVYGFIGALGVSINGGGGIGDRENSKGQTGFELNTRQGNLMIDYSFSQKLIGGFSFGYLSTGRTLGLSSGSLDSDSYRFAPFLLFRPTTNSYLTVMGGYALVNFDSTRSVVPVTDSQSQTLITTTDATAEYDADQYFASLGGGYTFSFMDGWSLKGYARGDYSHTDIEDFQEIGGFSTDSSGTTTSYATKVGVQSINSVTSTVGAELSYAISTSMLPAVIIPRFKAEWVHEFANSARPVQFTFNQTGTGLSAAQTTGTMSVAGPEHNWVNLGFGLQMLFPHAIVGFVNYEALIIDNASNHLITGGVRVNF